MEKKTSPIQKFALVQQIHRAIETTPLWEHVAERVAGLLQATLAISGPLLAELDATDAPWSEPEIVYTEKSGRFSVTRYALAPGWMSPVYDHCAWVVAGILCGEACDTLYSVLNLNEGSHLFPRQTERWAAGTVLHFVPPEDIHQIANRSPVPTQILQITGMPLESPGGALRQCYELPILPSMEDLAALPARA